MTRMIEYDGIPCAVYTTEKLSLIHISLEVVEADDDVRVHDGPADLGLLHIFAARHRHQRLVGALEMCIRDSWRTSRWQRSCRGR